VEYKHSSGMLNMDESSRQLSTFKKFKEKEVPCRNRPSLKLPGGNVRGLTDR